MEILLGLVAMTLAAGVTLILPLIAWARTHRLERQLTDHKEKIRNRKHPQEQPRKAGI